MDNLVKDTMEKYLTPPPFAPSFPWLLEKFRKFLIVSQLDGNLLCKVLTENDQFKPRMKLVDILLSVLGLDPDQKN